MSSFQAPQIPPNKLPDETQKNKESKRALSIDLRMKYQAAPHKSVNKNLKI